MHDVFIKSKSWTGYHSLIPEVHEYREPGCLVQAPCAVFRQAISPGDLCRLVQPDPSQHMNQGHLSPATTTWGGYVFISSSRPSLPQPRRNKPFFLLAMSGSVWYHIPSPCGIIYHIYSISIYTTARSSAKKNHYMLCYIILYTKSSRALRELYFENCESYFEKCFILRARPFA